eukprot:gene4744-34492_t
MTTPRKCGMLRHLRSRWGKGGEIIANLSIRGQSSRMEAQLSKKISDKVQGYQMYQLAGFNPHVSSSEVCKSMASEKRGLLRNCLGADQQPKKLGSGAFGVVHEGYYLGNEGDTRAIKLGHSMTEEQLLKKYGLSQEIANHIVTSGQSNCMECEGWFVKSVPQPDVRDSNGTPPARLYQTWMVMEKMDTLLADHFQECKSMDMGCYLDVQKDIVTGLQQIHQAGLHHNNLKDANILIKKGEGNHIQVKISDLGLSTHQGATRRNRGGTPGYMGICTKKEPHGEGGCKERDVFSWGKTTMEHYSLPFVKELSVVEKGTMTILQLLDMIAKAHSEKTLRMSSWDTPLDIFGTIESSHNAPVDLVSTSESSQDAPADILGTSESSQDAPVDLVSTSESSQDVPVDLVTLGKPTPWAPVSSTSDLVSWGSKCKGSRDEDIGGPPAKKRCFMTAFRTGCPSGTHTEVASLPIDIYLPQKPMCKSRRDEHPEGSPAMSAMLNFPSGTQTEGNNTPIDIFLPQKPRCKRSRNEQPGAPPAKRGSDSGPSMGDEGQYNQGSGVSMAERLADQYQPNLWTVRRPAQTLATCPPILRDEGQYNQGSGGSMAERLAEQDLHMDC